MDGGEGWGSIRCAGGVQDKTIMNRIMLRFRPIAPKPAAGGPLHGGSPGLKENVIVSQRTKRKYVRVRRSTINRGFNKTREKPSVAGEDLKDRSAVTLQLLPEIRIVEQKLASNGGSWCSKLNKQDGEDGNPLIRLNLNLMSDNDGPLDQTGVMSQRMKTVEMWVTVEYVRETCMDARGLGCTDMERLKNLEVDTCPGFVSDGLNRVVWVNGAFRKMVRLEEEEEAAPEMEVRLLVRERLAYRALTCQVKVQYTWWKEKYSQRVPCDAWRMDGGGFAWRLDVKAALSLGR